MTYDTYHLLALLLRYILYGTSELQMGEARGNSDTIITRCAQYMGALENFESPD